MGRKDFLQEVEVTKANEETALTKQNKSLMYLDAYIILWLTP